jgi:hypothetical protein
MRVTVMNRAASKRIRIAMKVCPTRQSASLAEQVISAHSTDRPRRECARPGRQMTIQKCTWKKELAHPELCRGLDPGSARR